MNFFVFQQPPDGWPKEKTYFGKEYMVNPFCTINALDYENRKNRKGKKKRRLLGRYKRPVRYKTRKTKLRRLNKQKRRINYRKSRPHRIRSRRRRKYF